jgi:predicted amidophosphoribosyltransferase
MIAPLRRVAVPLRRDRILRGLPLHPICPACTGAMREVPGFDDYCPACRLREELDREQRCLRGRIRLMEAINGHAQ